MDDKPKTAPCWWCGDPDTRVGYGMQPVGRPPWQAGWMEYRRADCTYWRCNAAALRMEQVAKEEVCR